MHCKQTKLHTNKKNKAATTTQYNKLWIQKRKRALWLHPYVYAFQRCVCVHSSSSSSSVSYIMMIITQMRNE